MDVASFAEIGEEFTARVSRIELYALKDLVTGAEPKIWKL